MSLTVFLDRDGVINRKKPEPHYVTSWEEFEFLPGALEGLAALTRSGAHIVVVTNQRGIARGVYTEETLADMHARMKAAVEASGGRIDAIYYCPHEGECDCRKPLTGMFERAAREIPGVDLAEAIVIGDAMCDLEAAARLGCPAVLVASGERKREILEKAARQGVPVERCAASLLEASEAGRPGGPRQIVL
jgi:D-glycero-D-manno-heptose 1,7-bisphosphate phosphatase